MGTLFLLSIIIFSEYSSSRSDVQEMAIWAFSHHTIKISLNFIPISSCIFDSEIVLFCFLELIWTIINGGLPWDSNPVRKVLTLSSGLFSHTVPIIKYVYNISPHGSE